MGILQLLRLYVVLLVTPPTNRYNHIIGFLFFQDYHGVWNLMFSLDAYTLLLYYGKNLSVQKVRSPSSDPTKRNVDVNAFVSFAATISTLLYKKTCKSASRTHSALFFNLLKSRFEIIWTVCWTSMFCRKILSKNDYRHELDRFQTTQFAFYALTEACQYCPFLAHFDMFSVLLQHSPSMKTSNLNRVFLLGPRPTISENWCSLGNRKLVEIKDRYRETCIVQFIKHLIANCRLKNFRLYISLFQVVGSRPTVKLYGLVPKNALTVFEHMLHSCWQS